jgi:CO/xanthine dehydrogenase FAD-binding subunit
MRQGRLSVSVLIDLAYIPELCRIEREKNGIVIGSMCRLRSLQKEERLAGPMDVLRQCAGHVSSMQVRNVATVGGNICNASPAADTVPGLLVLDAVARIYGKHGTREVLLESFFSGPGKTALRPDELLTGVFIPDTSPNTGAVYRKYSIRGDSDISIVGAGAMVTLDADRRITAVRIALASVGPTTLRMKREEQMLLGMRPETAILKDVADACAESCLPITDQRATKEYRKEMTRVWVEDALRGAIGSAEKALRG